MKRRCHLSILFLFLVYVNNPFGITSIGTLTGRVFHFKMTMTPKISILIEKYVDKFNVIKYIMKILCYENIEKRGIYSLKLIKCQQYFRASLCSIHSSKTEHREKMQSRIEGGMSSLVWNCFIWLLMTFTSVVSKRNKYGKLYQNMDTAHKLLTYRTSASDSCALRTCSRSSALITNFWRSIARWWI